MIVVDTSALMAIVLNEPEADACDRALQSEPDVLISAGTVVEALIVSMQRNADALMARLIDETGIEIVHVTPGFARRAGEAYRIWGKGRHPAALNFGDCFAYALAKERSCPLLFVGDDFSRTDIVSVL